MNCIPLEPLAKINPLFSTLFSVEVLTYCNRKINYIEIGIRMRWCCDYPEHMAFMHLDCYVEDVGTLG